MQLFFDLDGTLIDSLPRMFRLFCEMCPECTFSCGEYGGIKRQRMTQAQVLKNYFHYDDVRIAAFHKKWLEKIEEPERMLEDRPFPGITELLTELSCGRDLYIITNRQSAPETREQIRRMGWERLLTALLVTEQKLDKTALAASVLRDAGDALWIGDTCEDIKAAKALSIPVIAVTWGVMAPDLLAERAPDGLADSVEALREAILRFPARRPNE